MLVPQQLLLKVLRVKNLKFMLNFVKMKAISAIAAANEIERTFYLLTNKTH